MISTTNQNISSSKATDVLVRGSNARHFNDRHNMRLEGNANDDSDVVDERQVILGVVLMQPMRPTRMVEIDVLGDQTLADLADCFACASDDNSLALPNCRNKSMYIEGVFYDDTRHPDAERYSTSMCEWLAQGGPSVEPSDVDYEAPPHLALAKTMQETKLIDLCVRINAPYLYVHQGDCSHCFAFVSIRMASASDQRRRSAYPRVHFQQLPRQKKCSVCDTFAAQYITVFDSLAPEDPALFCEKVGLI